MDLFWSGLSQRASEHTRIERRCQFSKIHENAMRDIEKEMLESGNQIQSQD